MLYQSCPFIVCKCLLFLFCPTLPILTITNKPCRTNVTPISVMKCPSSIPNGLLLPCDYTVGSSCDFTCSRNYHKVADKVVCTRGGEWHIKTPCEGKVFDISRIQCYWSVHYKYIPSSTVNTTLRLNLKYHFSVD